MEKKAAFLTLLILTAVSVFASPIDVYYNGKKVSRVEIPEFSIDGEALMTITSYKTDTLLSFEISIMYVGGARPWYTQVVRFYSDGSIASSIPTVNTDGVLAILCKPATSEKGYLAIRNTRSSSTLDGVFFIISFDRKFNLILEEQ